MNENTIETKSNFKWVLKVVVALIIVAGSLLGRHVFHLAKLDKAEGYLQRGLAALAYEQVHPYRDGLSKNERGCLALFQIYSSRNKGEQLEWAAESCIENEVKHHSVFLAYAQANELMGRDLKALNILVSSAKNFEKRPEFYFQAGVIYERLKDIDAATQAFDLALQRSEENKQLMFKVLQFLVTHQKWQKARQLAGQLRYEKTQDPEVKLILAYAFKMGGDEASWKAELKAAEEMLEKSPNRMKALKERYTGVFEPSVKVEMKDARRAPASVTN